MKFHEISRLEISLQDFIIGIVSVAAVYHRRRCGPHVSRLVWFGRKTMFQSLVDTIIEWLRQAFFKQEMELTLVGLQNSGKTTLVNVIATGSFSEDMIPTVGFNMRKVTKGKVTIKLWDLGGQPRFRSMWERYCRGVHAIVYVVDSADAENSAHLPSARSLNAHDPRLGCARGEDPCGVRRHCAPRLTPLCAPCMPSRHIEERVARPSCQAGARGHSNAGARQQERSERERQRRCAHRAARTQSARKSRGLLLLDLREECSE